MIICLLSDDSESELRKRALALESELRGGATAESAIGAAASHNRASHALRLAVSGTSVPRMCDALSEAAAAPLLEPADGAAKRRGGCARVHFSARPARTALAVPGMATHWWWKLAPRVRSLAVGEAAAAAGQAIAAVAADASVLEAQRDLGEFQRLVFDAHTVLFGLLEACGVHFDCVAAFSSGEPTAAWLSGVFSQPAAAALCAAMARGNKLALGRGTLAILSGVDDNAQQAQQIAQAADLDVAAFMGVGLVALGGTKENVSKLSGICAQLYPSMKVIDSGLDVPFHTRRAFEPFRSQIDSFFEPVLDEARQDSREIERTWFSSTTADSVNPPEALSGNFWYRLLADTSDSVGVVQAMAADNVSICLELNCFELYSRTFRETYENCENAPSFFTSSSLFDLTTPESADAVVQMSQLADCLKALFLSGAKIDAQQALATFAKFNSSGSIIES